MPFDPLPAASTFANALLTIENQLGALDAKLAGLTFTAASTDGKVTVVADATIQLVSITVAPTLLTDGSPAALASLGTTLVTVSNQALAAAHTRAASEAVTATAAMNLQGVCAPSGPSPNYAGFAEASAALTAEEPSIDQRVAARQFQAQVGIATAVVNGRLDVVSVALSGLPDYVPVLATDVLSAVNQALTIAKGLVDDSVGTVVDGLGTSSVRLTDLCLYARNTLTIGDRVIIAGTTAGSFADLANAGSGETNLGVDCKVGNVWSRGPVTLRGAKVTGSVKTNQKVTVQAGTGVTGTITENGFIQTPNFGFSVTFPGANNGAVTVDPNQQRTLAPGAYAALIVNGGATLFLSTGTYFFDSFDLESNSIVSCSSGSGQVVIYVKGTVIFRGKNIEKTGGRPKFFLGAFGTAPIAVVGPFTGTLAAPEAAVTLNRPLTPGHSGAFFAKTLSIDPDGTVTWAPFGGVPALGTF